MALNRRHAALAAALAGTLMFTACGGGSSDAPEIEDSSAEFGFHDTGLPIVDKKLDLTFSGSKTALAPDFNTMTVVKNWEKDTNV
ncbi:sugar ABC transporter substrate-binding protein, partial [Glutamicibacter sp. AOP5-B1-3]